MIIKSTIKGWWVINHAVLLKETKGMLAFFKRGVVICQTNGKNR